MPTGSPVVVPKEDSGPWTDGMVVGHGFEGHNARSYKTWMIRACETHMYISR